MARIFMMLVLLETELPGELDSQGSDPRLIPWACFVTLGRFPNLSIASSLSLIIMLEDSVRFMECSASYRPYYIPMPGI